jgi:hypothetical protein
MTENLPIEETAMAKEQKRSSREVKKPKADKPKGPGSAYKQSQAKGGQAIASPMKKS